MGTACICYKSQKQTQDILPLQRLELTIENQNHMLTTREAKNKFMDIQNQQIDQSILSNLQLNFIHQELSRYLIEFQTKNGIITHRFTQKVLTSSSQEDVLGQFDDELQKNKENQDRIQKENELYLPLTNENAESDQSINSEMEAELSNNKSCLLSLSSRILNESLFTDRACIKKQFYSVFNRLGEAILSEWHENNRLSFEYQLQDIKKLRQKYFDSKFIACLNCFYFYWQSHFIHLLTYCKNPSGLKVYINGDMKMLPLQLESSSQLPLISVYEAFIQKLDDMDIAHLIFILTGWMPEHIYLTQIKNFSGILERLATNLIQGNTLVTFTRETKLAKEYATLLRIDFQNQLIYLHSDNKRNTIPDVLLENKDQSKKEIAIKFESFMQLYDVINLNWNPYIYELSQTCEGIITSSNKAKKFLLVIPSSSQDLQIRLFFQRHQDFINGSNLGIIINLYEYNGSSELGDTEPIRTMQTNEAIFSDVFIFQYCKQKTQYLLSVQIKEEEQDIINDTYFTLTLYSFAEMKFKELSAKPCLKRTSLLANITQDNVGYGINSPYFNKNLQISVETEIGGELQINIEASNKLAYQICLIPDPQKEKNLTKLKLENIINNSEISAEKNGKGSFFIKTAFSQYLLMINAYSPTSQTLNIQLKYYGKEINNRETVLKIDQIFQNYIPFFIHEIKWLPTHFGPRKRLKSNSTNDFQSSQIFAQFFKNPLLDKRLIKGTYQFFVKSETFRDYFDSVQSYEDKNSCEPPALSMAIFLASEDKKSYKIIVDDAYYVPFGVGFWTASIQLQEGTYRFVLPKMDKGFSKGIFGIIRN